MDPVALPPPHVYSRVSTTHLLVSHFLGNTYLSSGCKRCTDHPGLSHSTSFRTFFLFLSPLFALHQEAEGSQGQGNGKTPESEGVDGAEPPPHVQFPIAF